MASWPMELLGVSPTKLDFRTFALDDAIPSYGTGRISKGSILDFEFTGFVLPNSMAPTSSFTISTYVINSATSSYIVDSTNVGFIYKATVGGALNVKTLSADNPTAGVQTNYFFELILTSELVSTSAIQITFPIEFTIAGSCSILTKSANLNGASPICTADSIAKTILLQNIIATIVPGGSTISFKIDGITNPPSTKETSPFKIETLLDGSDLSSGIDLNTTTTVDFITPGILAQVYLAVIPENSVTSERSKYTFKFRNTNNLPAGGSIRVRIPKDVLSFPLPASTEGSLDPMTLSPSASASIDTTTSTTHNIIIITNAFDSAITTPTDFSFSLDFIDNPPTTMPQPVITFETYDNLGFLVDRSSPGVSLQISQPHSFNYVHLEPETLENGKTGAYTITITFKYPHYNDDIIRIDFPATTKLEAPSVTIAGGTSGGINVGNPTRVLNSVEIPLVLTSPAPASSTLVVTLSSITNKVYSSPLGSFTITSMDKYGFLRARTVEDPGLITTPAILRFPNTSVTPSVYTRGAEATYLFSIGVVNNIPDTGYILIYFPAEIPVPTDFACSNVAGLTPTCTKVGTNTIKLKSSSYDPNIDLKFTISKIKNPTSDTSGSFRIETYTEEGPAGLIMDKAITDLVYNADCDLPCKTCSGSRDYCTSCFTDPTISIFQILQGNTCTDSCPPGQTVSNFECKPCIANCAECSDTVSTCTKCLPGFYLDGTKCVAICPAKYYGDPGTGVCTPCSSECVTCSYFDKCTSCPPERFLYNQTCFQECPELVTVPNGPICEPCDTKCTTCITTPDTCLTCVDGFINYQQKCLSECPPGMFHDTNLGTCVGCSDPCLECTTGPTHCSKCKPGTGVQYQGDCVPSCPPGMYADANNVCQNCVAGCTQCTSAVTCTSCSSPLGLYNGECIACPTGTTNVLGLCQPCATGCTACEESITKCTSCDSGSYLYNSQCLQQCPDGFYGNNGVCTPCDPSCGTCFGGSPNQCSSCDSNYLTPSKTCSPACPDGYYADPSTHKCSLCNSDCTKCFGPTSSQCTECKLSKVLYNYQCIDSCPEEITVNVNGVCQSCDSSCTKCTVSPTRCTECSGGRLFLPDLFQCLSTCPDGRYAYQGQCKFCNSPCATCITTADNCQSCKNGLYVYKGACLDECPLGTRGVSTPIMKCLDPTDPGYDDITVSESGVVPFPFLIATGLILLGVVGAKATSKETVISSNAIAFISIVEVAAWITLILLVANHNYEAVTTSDFGFYLLIIAIVINYICNILHLISVCLIGKSDGSFREWMKSQPHRRSHAILLFIATITSFKIYRLTYNRLFGLTSFSAKLSSVKALKTIHLITIGSFMLANGTVLVGAISLLQKSSDLVKHQLTITALEIPIISVIMIAFGVFDMNKSESFFGPQETPQPVMPKISNKELASPEKIKITVEDGSANKSHIRLLDDESRIHYSEAMNTDAGHEDILSHYLKTTSTKRLPELRDTPFALDSREESYPERFATEDILIDNNGASVIKLTPIQADIQPRNLQVEFEKSKTLRIQETPEEYKEDEYNPYDPQSMEETYEGTTTDDYKTIDTNEVITSHDNEQEIRQESLQIPSMVKSRRAKVKKSPQRPLSSTEDDMTSVDLKSTDHETIFYKPKNNLLTTDFSKSLIEEDNESATTFAKKDNEEPAIKNEESTPQLLMNNLVKSVEKTKEEPPKASMSNRNSSRKSEWEKSELGTLQNEEAKPKVDAKLEETEKDGLEKLAVPRQESALFNKQSAEDLRKDFLDKPHNHELSNAKLSILENKSEEKDEPIFDPETTYPEGNKPEPSIYRNESQLAEGQIRVSNDSIYRTIGGGREFLNEDTPSNYNAMNQRFDEEYMRKVNENISLKRSQFKSMLTDPSSDSKLALPKLIKQSTYADEPPTLRSSEEGRSRSNKRSTSLTKSSKKKSPTKLPKITPEKHGSDLRMFEFDDRYDDFMRESSSITTSKKRKGSSSNLPNIYNPKKF